MTENKVIIIAFQEQDNLGVGYLCSFLLQAGFHPLVIDFRFGKESILRTILSHHPILVGFSIIFQYHISEFKDLISYLRANAIQCHFCAGGHYPSLRPKETLRMITDLDSVVLFEGEYTFLELLKAISSGKDWKIIDGIAHREDHSIVTNPVHTVEKDLDKFPFPLRPPLREFVLGKKFATLIASRGCIYNCSFCSIREFYSRSSGPLKRVRKPEMVVDEITTLYEEKGCSIFMFQDDDFPLAGKKGREWVTRFCHLLNKRGLSNKIMWKINCRPDEVDRETFRMLRDSGLFLVYLGIESGTDEGLKFMKKHMSANISIRAVNDLKKLQIDYDFGFMLFDPSTTFQSILENLDFLEKICGDGSAPIVFCKMLPYAETDIEKLLLREGRLKGEIGYEDYDFSDPLVNQLFHSIQDCFFDWMGTRSGLLNMCKWMKYYVSIYRKYFFPIKDVLQYIRSTKRIIRDSNAFLLRMLRKLCNIYLRHYKESECGEKIDYIKNQVITYHDIYKKNAKNLMLSIESLVQDNI